MKKRVVILGSTGSIGTNALNVIAGFKDKFEVLGLSASSNVTLLTRQIKKFKPKAIVLRDEAAYNRSKKSLKKSVDNVFVGVDGLCKLSSMKNIDILLVAISGSDAIRPVLSGIRHSKRIALANKECIVSAGSIIMPMAKKFGTEIIPIDSEHNAIFQCLEGRTRSMLSEIYLTGSGGPLRNVPFKDFKNLTVEKVLKHPRWKMGRKISVDSATLMNKGLEIIEAKWLFDVGVDRIKVLIHPEAIVHSMVEFVDSGILAQMAVPDMKIPIQYALTYPERADGKFEKVDFCKLRMLTFENPDMVKFPLLKLAYLASRKGGNVPAALNAANEVAVNMFLNNVIPFLSIAKIVQQAVSEAQYIKEPTIDDIFETDRIVKEKTRGICLQ